MRPRPVQRVVIAGVRLLRFSVIIPLQFHRDRALDCVRGWVTTQALPADEYELICILPARDPDRLREPLARLLRPRDRLILSTTEHDMAQCVEGANAATGEFLLFTESHAWPERDVLREILAEFDRHPEWQALSGRTIALAETRLARAEADHYERDIHTAMTAHPWRKILDQIFIARRKAYLATGGFDPALGHFAEWALAARYADLGFEVGYAPHIVLRHCSSGNVAELSAFTRSFIAGEIAYFARGRTTDSVMWNEIPPEWSHRGSFNPRLAAPLATCVRKVLLANLLPGERGILLKEYARSLAVAARLAPAVAAMRVAASRIRLAAATVAGTRRALERSYTDFTRSIIHHERLRELAAQPSGPPRPDGTSMRIADDRHAGHIAGFHLPESCVSTRIRWSRPAALVELPPLHGTGRIGIKCTPARGPLAEAVPAFFLNEVPVAPDRVAFEGHNAIVTADADAQGPLRLAWVCKPFATPGGARPLGLPVNSIAMAG
jgi:hypothetical protein